MLLFTGLVLAAQLINTVFLWISSGSFPVWSGIATVGLTVFLLSAIRRYRRTSAPPGAPISESKTKRRRLRDPHRKRR